MVEEKLGYWIRELKGFRSPSELRQSDFFRREESALRIFLNTPESYPFPGTAPHLRRFLRAVSWNIEKGLRWQGIAEALRVHPHLRVADLLFLNEVDVGMARSGNVHVAKELSHALRMNCIFAPAHLELTKGLGMDLDAPGENSHGVQGNVILSRYPLAEARIVELPACDSLYEAEERRYGRRIALCATVFTSRGKFRAVCTHLEVRNTPRCRASQMQALLKSLDVESPELPVLLGGDLNTHTFSRGTAWRTISSYVRIGLTRPDRLVEQLKRPDRGAERLFQALDHYGYSWEEFNDYADTCGIQLPDVSELSLMPRFVHDYARSRTRTHNHQLRFRLDWFAGRGMKSLRRNEETDLSSGTASLGALTIAEVNDLPTPLSDHHPILVDLQLPPEEATETEDYAVA